MKSLKTVHIHTDIKFIEETKLFEGDKFSNKVIIIGNSNHIECSFEVEIINRSYFGIQRIVELCKQSDIVILYDLDPIKSAIVNSLPDHVYVAWRFFGYELYKRYKDKYLSELSRSVLVENQKIKKTILSRLKYVVSTIRPVNLLFDSSFEKAVKRVDSLLCISKSEYDELLETWPDLPECTIIPVWDQWETEPAEELRDSKKPVIIIGNNRSIYNNHLDLIEGLKECEKSGEFTMVFPFSYGSETGYSDKVHSKIELKDNFKVLHTFLPFNQYIEFVKSSYAIVINSYRQMAMDNIFIAIRNGVKIYLNRKNIIYNWLISKGFLVFDIDQLLSDINSDQVRLDKHEIQQNIDALRRYEKEYPIEQFQELIYRRSFKNISHDTDH